MKMAVTLPKTFVKWILDRKKQLCHRQLLVIAGEHAWVKNSITTIRPLLTENSIYVGESDWPIGCQNSTYRSQLGLEFDHLVYDTFCGLRANALIALSGTVKSGGLMILLTPPLDSWSSFTDPEKQQRTSFGYDCSLSKSNFIVWLINRIQSDSSVSVLSENGFSGNICNVINENPITQIKDLTTPEQCKVVDKIVSNYHLKTTFQMVLTADRGRGKSAALGLAAQRLLDEVDLNIAVTAPNKSMTQSVFKHVNNKSNVTYKPFDELLSSKQEFDLLFVDEAAAIPTAVLKLLVSTFPKIIFSTTTHGYEGSGKGFELRFTPYLQKLKSNFETFTLESPVRWFEDDVLEKFWFETMLMTPLSVPIVRNDNNEKILTSRILGPEELVSNSDIFYQIFQLLVNAHYQTTPDDLVRLLDAPEQSVHVTTIANAEVVGVALVSLEGGSRLDDIATAISEGSRRVNGHLIPQRLAFVRCSPKFALKKYTRIIRIAVKTEHRRLKIATKLIDHITSWSFDNGGDFIGASFGASVEVIKFWQSNKFNPVHLGLKKDASSGGHSLIVLKRLRSTTDSEYQGEEEVSFLIRKFIQELSFQSGYRLAKIDKNIIKLLHSQSQKAEKTLELDLIDMTILGQFASGLRPIFSCEYQLAKLIERYSLQLTQINMSEYEFFYHLLAEKWPYKNIREHYGLSGKKQIEDHARNCCSILLQAIKKTQ